MSTPYLAAMLPDPGLKFKGGEEDLDAPILVDNDDWQEDDVLLAAGADAHDDRNGVPEPYEGDESDSAA
jgi:hypothetical protein